MSGIHFVVFCAADYEHLLSECIQSAKQYVKDEILSITVVSNSKITTEYPLVLDREFWNLFDSEFEYSNVYKHNWVKQQILKLNLDRLFTGNILLCDVEVRFNKSIKWVDGDKFNIFYKDRPMNDSYVFVNDILGITPTNGFVTEAILFKSEILADLRNFIEEKFKCNQLEAYRNLVYDDPTSETPLLKVFMSEYELYSNFVIQFYPEHINELQKHSSDWYYSSLLEIQTKDNNSQTQWISFYEQVRSPEWPDCYKEEDFVKLPEYIQQECMDVHGYKPFDKKHIT